MVDPDEWVAFLKELDKIDLPKLRKKLSTIKIPKHTGSTIIVGGVRPSCPCHPNYWKGPRKVWCCPKDCPACAEDKKREKRYGKR